MTVHHFQGKKVEDARIAEEVRVWRTNRLAYPGWIVLPRANRDTLWTYTECWSHLIVVASREQRLDIALSWLAELTWRLEQALRQLSPEHVEALEWVTQVIVPKASLAAKDVLHPGADDDGDMNWSSIAEDWAMAMAALLRVAREKRDIARFLELRGRLEQLGACGDFVAHEACLLALEAADQKGAGDEAAKWAPGEPTWMLRKAAVLAEIGNEADANRTAREVLEDTRRSHGHHQGRFAALSLEGWSAELVRVTERRHWDRSEWRWRMDELSRYRCDPGSVLGDMEEKLKAAVWHLKSRSQHQPEVGLYDVAPYSFARACELAGRPAHSGNIPRAAPGMGLAAAALSSVWPERAFSLLLRAGGEEQIAIAFSRHRVAALETGTADIFSAILLNRLQAVSLPASGHRSPVLVETILSFSMKLVTRASGTEAMSFCREAIRLLSSASPVWPTWRFLIGLLQGGLASLSVEERTAFVLPILDLPLVGRDLKITDGSDDIANLLLSLELADVETTAEQDRTHVADRLLLGLAAPGDSHVRACLRLSFMHRRKMLPSSSADRVAKAIWQGGTIWPDHPGIADWVILNLPDGNTGLAEAGFLTRCATRQLDDVTRIETSPDGEIRRLVGPFEPPNDPLVNAWFAMRRPWQAHDPKGLAQPPWTGAEIGSLLKHTVEWWEREGRSLARDGYAARGEIQPTGRLHYTVNLIYGYALTCVDLAEDVIVDTCRVLREAGDKGFPVAAAAPLFARLGHDGVVEAAHRLRAAFASGEEDYSEGAAVGTFAWWDAARHGTIAAVPGDLIESMAHDVRMRRQGALPIVTFFLTRILETDSGGLPAHVLQGLSIGLNYLLEDTRYRLPTDRDGLVPYNKVPETRFQAASLASILARFEDVDRDIIDSWINSAASDPLTPLRLRAATWASKSRN